MLKMKPNQKGLSLRSLFRAIGCLGVVVLINVPTGLLAIHSIRKDAEPIQREHGPLTLGMSLPVFLKTIKSREEPAGIGQFEEEKRFNVDTSTFPPEVQNVIGDFYNEMLFRIEINYKPVHKASSPLLGLKEKWSAHYGPPRINSLPGTEISFWDDGNTRLILEEEEEEKWVAYSMTYIDDDLFHQASRERVQKETQGKSSYGK